MAHDANHEPTNRSQAGGQAQEVRFAPVVLASSGEGSLTHEEGDQKAFVACRSTF